MNYSMMSKGAGAVFLLILLIFAQPFRVHAQEGKSLPEGEVLIVYSDGAKDEELENVYRIVETLTYQGVQVTFAPASDCVGSLSDFARIIFYEVKNYPQELCGEIRALEQEGQSRLLFAGSAFLKEYLDGTRRSGSYVFCDETSAAFTYRFDGQKEKQTLAACGELIFLKNDLDYQSGFLETETQEGYFRADSGVITHITVSDFDNSLVFSAFVKELSAWRQEDGAAQDYVQYIVLNEAYPFQNPEKLLTLIGELTEKHMPFIISVMPVYSNGDYPAMQRFCEVLRYAQDNGGAVILHAPINQSASFDVDSVNDYLAQALNLYIEQGVYPVGLQAPKNWMTNSGAVEVMSHFQTILVSDETDDLIEADWDAAQSNLVNRDAHQWIAPAIALNDNGTSSDNAYPAAVYLNMSEELDVLTAKLETFADSYVMLGNLWEVSCSLYTSMDAVSYKDGKLYVNGSRVDLTFTPTEYAEDYSYNRNQLQRFSVDLTSENQKLFTAVTVLATLFIIFIIMARRNNRRRFFYEEEEEDLDEYWENKG